MVHKQTARNDAASHLSRNDALVLNALREQSAPMKAYDLLDRLKEDGVRAPMTVYRALDSLTEKGLVHKVDALNAFVVCTHPGEHKVQRFLVCKNCGTTIELEPGDIDSDMEKVIKKMRFHTESGRLEIVGHCADCLE